jgi:hypothetical protein
MYWREKSKLRYIADSHAQSSFLPDHLTLLPILVQNRFPTAQLSHFRSASMSLRRDCCPKCSEKFNFWRRGEALSREL